MKKLISLLLAAAILCGITACAGNHTTEDGTASADGTQEGTVTSSDETSEETTGKKEKMVDYEMETVGSTLVGLVKEEHPDNEHPRIIFDKERVAFWKSQIGTQSVYDKEYRAMKKAANGWLLNDSLPKYDTYDDVNFLIISREVLSCVEYCALTYLLTGEEQFAERAAKELDAAAAFADWKPYHFLNIGEMANAFGLGYDWLYDYLSDERKEAYRNAVIKSGFDPAMKDYENKLRKRSYKWYQDTPGDNWKLVCNGGLSVAALAMCDEISSDICEKVLYYSFVSSHKFIRDAYSSDDGSYVEGTTYWTYATLYLGMYSTALMTACGTNLDLTDWIGLEKTGYFPIMLSSNTLRSFNFGDAESVNMVHPNLLFLGHEFGRSDIGYFRYDYIKGGSTDIYDIFWLYPEDNYEGTEVPCDYGEIGVTNATFRTGWDKNDMFCGIHFGKNAVPHGHSDMGTFIIEYKNRRFFEDLGADGYGLDNYRLCYRCSAEGHNTLVFNPLETLGEGGQKSSGESYISQYKSSDAESFAVCDMTGAYWAKSVKRGLKLLKNSKTVILQDEIECGAEDEIYWFGQTTAEITVSDDGKTAKLKISDATVYAYILGGDGTFSVTEAKSSEWSPKISGQAQNAGFRRLTVRMSGKTSYTLSIAFVPEGENAPEGIKSLSDWK
ncbi:MAG: heparinase II/III family protein [Firmicutes bacterium]|nr:heparinase II/III family protein [Candidatus Colimorpha enterica]